MDNSILVSKIQTFSVHDGPGIRTTVFLKGCSLNCPWCANPENINCNNEYWFDKDKCITGVGKGCSLSSECESCPLGAKKLVAKYVSAVELVSELLKYSAFYGTDGGVTFSGGEALLQIFEMEPALEELKKNNINICFETALHVPEQNCNAMLHYADEIFVDMKDALSATANYWNNLNNVDQSGVKYIIRIPLIKPFTFNEENMKEIKQRLKTLHPEKIQVFRAHSLAKKKYEMLGKKFVSYENVSEKEVYNVAKMLNAEVLSIG